MKCNTVRYKLAGYLDDAVTGAALVEERVHIREHLDSCAQCREELQRYRKLSMLLSRVPRNLPPADLAVRIRVAAAQSVPTQDLPGRMQRIRDRAELLLDNVFRPLTLPASPSISSALRDCSLFPTTRPPGPPSSTTSSFLFRTACSLMSPWISTAKWSATKFFPAPGALTSAISSIRCSCSPASAP